MKILTSSIIFLIVIHFSCKESLTQNTNDQIKNDTNSVGVHSQRIYLSSSHLVDDSVMSIVNDLFQKNNLSLDNLQVYQYHSDSLGYYVSCNQFFQHIPIFITNLIFNFNSQKLLKFRSGKVLSPTAIDTIPKITMDHAGILFYQGLVSDSWYAPLADTFKQQGFNAELGLFDLNYTQIDTASKIVLIWKVDVSKRGLYPRAFIRADTALLIYYQNGINND